MGAETVDCRSCSPFYGPLRRLRSDEEKDLSHERWKFIDPCRQLRADDGQLGSYQLSVGLVPRNALVFTNSIPLVRIVA